MDVVVEAWAISGEVVSTILLGEKGVPVNYIIHTKQHAGISFVC